MLYNRANKTKVNKQCKKKQVQTKYGRSFVKPLQSFLQQQSNNKLTFYKSFVIYIKCLCIHIYNLLSNKKT